MKWLAVMFLFFIALPIANAVVISQVLYDPLGSERGGEAVELRNNGPAVDIGGWVLATEASQSDATIPEGTILVSGSSFLIADSGWDSARDDPGWKDADLEETITLANSNSGIAIKDADGSVVDAVGWGDASGIKTGLFEGVPASEVEPGMALLRSGDSGNNMADFSSAVPAFFSGGTVEVVVNISEDSTTLPLGAALYDDDLDEPGVQLKPVAGGTRALRLEANYSGDSVMASWFDSSVSLERNGSLWVGELPLKYWYPPGGQTILVSTPTQNISLPVMIMELKSARLVTKKVVLEAIPGRTAYGTIEAANQGNVPVEVSWGVSEFVFGSSPFVSPSIVGVQETGEFEVALDVPYGVEEGEYRTVLRMIEE